MANNIGKTNKYSNLLKTVNPWNKPQEQTIWQEDIKKAFSDFWYSPDNWDLSYWSTIPVSQKWKLMSELKSRRDGDLKNSANSSPKQLTNDQISALYSEYWFKLPQNQADFDWVRKNFPDDEKKFRSILDEHRDNTNQLQKIKNKQNIDQLKNWAQPTNQSANDWQGWPGDTYNWTDPATGKPTTAGVWTPTLVKAHFPSQYQLIQFTGDPNWAATWDQKTVWLLNNNTKTIQPFLSMDAIKAAYWDNYDQAIKSIAKVDPKETLSGWYLGDFSLLGNNYWIKEDGNIKTPEFWTQDIASRYWQQANEQTTTTGYTALDGYLNMLKSAGGAGISTDTLNSVLSDPQQMAMYIWAFTYWGYSLNDIYADMKKKDMVNQGNSSYNDISVINPTMKKEDYVNTQKWQEWQQIAALQPPQNIGKVSSSFFNSGITALPDEAFKTLVPALDPNSPEFKDKLSQISDMSHDMLIQQLTAKTEADKAKAQNDYNNFKDYIDKIFGYKLSSDALEWWNQINNLNEQMENQGIAWSGIENQKIDTLLKTERMNDQSNKALKAMYQSQNRDIDYYTKYASPDEIQKMNEEDAASWLDRSQWRSVQWWLAPADPNQWSLDALKQKYPGKTDDELQRILSQTVDENGNFRSDLYSNLESNKENIQYGGNLQTQFWQGTVDPVTGNQIKAWESAEEYKARMLYDKNLQDQKKAAAPYTMTDPNDPFGNLGVDNSLSKLPTGNNFSWYTGYKSTWYTGSNIDRNTLIQWSSLPTAGPSGANKTNNITIPKWLASWSVPISWAKYNTKQSQTSNFSNITPKNWTLYWVPKNTNPAQWLTRVPNTSYLKNYNSNQVTKYNWWVYLNKGVKQTW